MELITFSLNHFDQIYINCIGFKFLLIVLNLEYFIAIEFFRLVLSKTDIASDEIERIINPFTLLFNGLKVFELVDNSSFRGTFGVFLGFYKNLRNIKKLILRTPDHNLNVLLNEFLPSMANLEELLLTSEAPRSNDRYEIIRRSASKLNKMIVTNNQVEIARNFFPASVTIISSE